MRLRRLLAAAGIAHACVAASGCSVNQCSPGATRCAGDAAQSCQAEDGTGFHAWLAIDCGAQGQTCRQGVVAECVYADRPCTASACTGGEAIVCGTSGFVIRDETCDADANCHLAGGHAACVYADPACPASGARAFCAADGVTLYDGCDLGFGAATRRVVCSAPTPDCIAVGAAAHCGT